MGGEGSGHSSLWGTGRAILRVSLTRKEHHLSLYYATSLYDLLAARWILTPVRFADRSFQAREQKAHFLAALIDKLIKMIKRHYVNRRV
jgi:hypothetical protein